MSTYINAWTLTSCIGAGLDETRKTLKQNLSGLQSNDWPGADIDCWIGKVNDDLLQANTPVAHWNSRNNRLALTGLQHDRFDELVKAAINEFGNRRVGIALGTSTSSIGRTENAYTCLETDESFNSLYQQSDIHTPHSTGAFLADHLCVSGPCVTISTACSSSAKAFATADRWIKADIVDAVVVAGVDSLCLSVIHGFNSLQLVSEQPCKPFDIERSGISLGEAAGFALVSRKPSDQNIRLSGYGESTDAWHMSTPHPEGLGARLAMEQALARSGLQPDDIGYLNLHGTGTRANDESEGGICASLFDSSLRAAATKGFTGHTLGAAGIVEAIFALEAVTEGLLAGTANTKDGDTAISDRLIRQTITADVQHAMTNSFGFGGNNCTLIFSRDAV